MAEGDVPGGAGDANAMQPVDQNEPGLDGAPAGPGGNLGPGNFRNPMVSAAAFLRALQAKNPEAARTEAERAIMLDSSSDDAKQLLGRIAAQRP